MSDDEMSEERFNAMIRRLTNSAEAEMERMLLASTRTIVRLIVVAVVLTAALVGETIVLVAR